MRAAAVLLLVAIGCTKTRPGADSANAGTPADTAITNSVTPASTPAGTTTKTQTSANTTAGTRVAGGDPVQREQTTPIPTGDVIVGRVAEHGADPLTFIAITQAGGTQTRVSGAQLAALGAVKGAEVWARGRRDGNSFVVDTFEVRRANNQAVEDGIVSVSGSTVTVRTARGSLTYRDAPTALRSAAGARVWITPPVAGQAPSFGVIRPAAPAALR